VRADEDVIKRQGAAEQFVHAIQLATGLVATRQAGLVGGDDEAETFGFEFGEQRRDRLVDTELPQRQGTALVLTFDPNLVQYPVPLKKYTLSHTSVRA
jgi:hypothetical protein